MDGNITGENDDSIGLHVTDNNGVKHKIELRKDTGKIYHHNQDGYPDKAAKRTDEGNEHVEQARRFAKYYVYLEKGFDTVRPEIHPERLNAVRLAVANLDIDEFETLFGDLYYQLRSYEDPDVPRLIELPADAASDDSVLYRQHVYLGLDPLKTDLRADAQELAAKYDLDLSGEDINQTTFADGLPERWQAFADELDDLATATETDLSEGLYIDGVSSLYTAYIDSDRHEHIGEPDEDPYDREPDALLELPVMDTGPLEEFQTFLTYNLACQIRDCFIRMGLEPPERFQILGYGRFEAAEQYRRLDMFPNYIDPHEEKAFI